MSEAQQPPAAPVAEPTQHQPTRELPTAEFLTADLRAPHSQSLESSTEVLMHESMRQAEPVNVLAGPASRKRQRLWSFTRIARDYAYVMPGFFLSLLAFVVLVPLFSISVGTAVLWIGIPSLLLTLIVASWFARLSRIRARAWGAELPTVHYAPARPGFWGLLARIGEPRRWLDLAFETLVAFPLRTASFVIATVWTLIALGGVTYFIWAVFLPPVRNSLASLILESMTAGRASDALAHSEGLDFAFNFVVGAVFLVTLPLVMRALASLDAAATVAALGGASANPSAERDATALANEQSDARAASASTVPVDGWTWIAAIVVAIVSVAVNWPVLSVAYGVHVVFAMLVTCASAGALILVVRLPLAAIILQTISVTATALLTAESTDVVWPWPVMSLIVQAVLVLLLALRTTGRWAFAMWASPVLVTAAIVLMTGLSAGSVGNLIIADTVSLGMLVLGVVLRQLIASRGALVAERQRTTVLSTKSKALAERNRIAHELHDVVAHSMSVISVQANTAKYRLTGLDAATESEFESIAASSRQALTEMRSLLALLRAGDDERELALAPQPSLSDLPALVEATRQSGAQLTLALSAGAGGVSDGVLDAVPAATGLTAYRMVQEALSNAVRHSPGAAIDVVVAVTDAAVEIRVTNGPAVAPGAHRPAPGAGLGLAGVRERTAALGGSVEAGPTASGGYALAGTLPLSVML